MTLRKSLAGLLAAALLAFPPTALAGLGSAVFTGLSAAPALADQSPLCFPTTGVLSGLDLVTDLNAALKALETQNLGTSPPANDCTAAPVQGQIWIDSSGTVPVAKWFDGTVWDVVGVLNTVDGLWEPPIGGGAGSVASASTADLWGVPQSLVTITGTTTISKLAGSGAVVGTEKSVIFAAALQLTYSGTQLILPTGHTITTAAGDTARVVVLGGGNVRVLSYTRADGTPLAANAVFGANVAFTGIISPTAISGTVNDWTPTGIATATVVRVSASAAATLTGIAAQANNWVILQNAGSNAVTLSDANAGSSAANRFSLGVDYVLAPQAAVQIRYDGSLSRWVLADGRPAATSSQATTGTDNGTMMTPLRTAQAIAALGSTSSATVYSTPGTFTWTKPASGTVANVACWGGGGSGAASTTAGQSGGGGGGAFVQFFFPLASLPSTETVTVAAGGASVSSSTTGNNGGTSSFGSLLIAYGGGGGTHGGSEQAGGGGGGQGGTGGQGTAGIGLAGTYAADPGIGGASTVSGTTTTPGLPAYYGGGGGGIGQPGGGTANNGGAGGNSVFGAPGGGGSANSNSFVGGSGGTSVFARSVGGTGGRSTSNATAGTQPGAGGGGSGGGTSGAGGNGECIVAVSALDKPANDNIAGVPFAEAA